MKIGANDVVMLDEDQHLLMVIQRELNNREERDRRRIAERRFNEVSRRNQQLLDSSRDSIAFVQDGMFLYANDAFAEMLKYTERDDLECMPVIDIVDKSEHAKVKGFLKEFTLKGSDLDSSKLEFNALCEDRSELTLHVDVCLSNYDDETCIQFLVKNKPSAQNITTSQTNNAHLEEKLKEIKNQDVATGLYNKNYLVEKLELAVDKAVKKEFNSALLHIGIDNFLSTVQEKLGVASADIALGTIAGYTKSLVGKNQVLCRFTETSFMLLIQNTDASKALDYSKTLVKKLRDYVVEVENSTLHFHYHIGVGLINETSTNSDLPIQHAIKALDLAVNSAQEDSETLARIYEPEVTAAPETKQDISRMVQNALDAGKFKVLFQPILSLRGSNKEHYEVLMRMVDDEGNEISPTEFLTTAAKIGATTKLDRWVIMESIKLLTEHRSKGHDTQLIINLCRESMLDATLQPWLSVAFKAAKLPFSSIIFQLNEIDINDHLNVASKFTKDITSLGCQFSVNRFGCALNPFNALKSIDASYIKIDGSFTEELQKNGEDTTSLNEIVSELHKLDKITIVPFVENASVLSKLWQSGVHYIQGYYLQEPADKMDYDFDMEN